MTTPRSTLTPIQLKLICELAVSSLSTAGGSSLRQAQARVAIQLLREGATVPFIARYRKERTGGLDEVQLRSIQGALNTVDALEVRRDAIMKRLKERRVEGVQISDALLDAIKGAQSLSLGGAIRSL